MRLACAARKAQENARHMGSCRERHPYPTCGWGVPTSDRTKLLGTSLPCSPNSLKNVMLRRQVSFRGRKQNCKDPFTGKEHTVCIYPRSATWGSASRIAQQWARKKKSMIDTTISRVQATQIRHLHGLQHTLGADTPSRSCRTMAPSSRWA